MPGRHDVHLPGQVLVSMTSEGLAFVITLLVIAAFIALRRYLMYAEKARLDKAMQAHLQTLKLRHKRLAAPNAYGHIDHSRWHKEIDVFVRSTLGDCKYLSRDDVIKRVTRAIEDDSSDLVDVLGMDPLEFEAYCADILRKKGWATQVTGTSGDQGIDIIARKNGRKAVLQCKLHHAPVSNSAVQEVIAGRTFEDADIAAVVTNSRFTRSAVELAHAAGVLLLHHTQLDQLDRDAGG